MQKVTLLLVLLTIVSNALPLANLLEKGSNIEDQESFISNVCSDNVIKEQYVLSIDKNFKTKSIKELCSNRSNGILLQIPVSNMEWFSIPKNQKILGQKSEELCLYDSSSNDVICSRQQMNGTDSVNFNLILEKLPERYEVGNLKFDNWMNVTFLEETVLGYTFLKNRESTPKFIEQDISYIAVDYQEYVFPFEGDQPKIPLKIYESDTLVLDLKEERIKDKKLFEMFHVIRYMPPHMAINATLKGMRVKKSKSFTAQLDTVYHENWSLPWSKKSSQISGHMIETGAIDVQISYKERADILEYKDFADPASHQINIRIENTVQTAQEREQVYPGFKPYALAGGILLGSIVLIVSIDIIRRTIINRRNKKDKAHHFSRF